MTSRAPYVGGGVGAAVAEADGVGDPLFETPALAGSEAAREGSRLGVGEASVANPPLASVKMRASSTMIIPVRPRTSPMSHGTACSAVVGRRRSPQRRVSHFAPEAPCEPPLTGMGGTPSGRSASPASSEASSPGAPAGWSSRSRAGQERSGSGSGSDRGWSGGSPDPPCPLMRPLRGRRRSRRRRVAAAATDRRRRGPRTSARVR